MGLIVRRNIAKLGIKEINSNGFYTYFNFFNSDEKKYEFNVRNTICMGCCTGSASAYTLQPSDIKNETNISEYGIITYNLNFFPTLYNNLNYINSWLDFIKNAFPFIDFLEILKYKDEINESVVKELNIDFKFNNDEESNRIYFIYKKHFSKKETEYRGSSLLSYYNLFIVSLIRYFTNEEYIFMIYDCLRLRKLKSLSKLDNLDIINIAKQAHTFTTNKDGKNSNYPFLFYYRSPFENGYAFQKPQLNIDEIYDKLIGLTRRMTYQNDAVSIKNDLWNKYNGIYLSYLFQTNQYLKIHKILNDDSNYVKLPTFTILNSKCSFFNYDLSKSGVMNNNSFNAINNKLTIINIKEYEKTFK